MHRAAGFDGPENGGGCTPDPLAYHAGFAQLIAAISRDFIAMAPDQIDRGIQAALRAVGEYTGVDRAFLFRLSDDLSLLVNTHEWCADPADSQLQKFQGLPTKALPWAGSRIASRKAICVPRVSELPPEKHMWESVGSKSLIILPLEAAGELLGALALDTVRDEREWSDDLIASLGTVGEVLANALDRKRREEAPRESEERFRGLFENALVAYQSLDANGDFIEVNETWCKVFGYTKEEVLGRNFSEFIHPDFREVFKENFPKFKSVGYTLGVEFEMIKKDGSEIIVAFDGKIGYHVDGSFEKTHCVLSDITERKRVEKEVALLSSAIEQSGEGIGVVDSEGNLLFLNSAFAAMHGYSKEELVGKHLPIFHTPEQMPSVEKANRQLMQTGEFIGEIWHVRRDGTVFPSWMHNSILRDETDNPIGIVGTLLDITERKRAEEALRESEARFRGLFFKSPDAYLLLIDGVHVDCNEACLEMLQATRDQVVGKSPASLSPERQPDGRLSVEAVEEKIREVMETGSARFEWVHRRMDGTEFWTEVVATAMDIDGSDGLFGVWRDITERKRDEEELRESEEKYRSLFESSGDASFILSISEEDGVRFVDCNSSTLPLFGCTERHQILGKPPEDFSPPRQPDGKPSAEKVRQLAMATRLGDPQVFEWEHHRLDGTPFFVEVTLSRIDFKGEALMQAVVRDITERKRAEDEKLALQRQLLHAQKLESLGVLAGGIAHDFNNILVAIVGNADLALDELSAMSPARGKLREIEKASKRAAELAKQMLAYSGKGRFVVEPIDAGELIEEIAHLLEVSISKKAVLKYNFAENLPSFDGDVTQIRQVVMNLITNASEALGDEGGVIALSTGARYCDRAYLDDVDAVLRASLDEPLPEGVYTCFEVADTGCGMDAETIEKVFDPFFTTKFTGRGLGMSAVLGIVRGHKGALKIDSEVGKGTTFKVLFPANEPRENGFAVRRKAAAEGKDWRGSGTILIADDEQMVCAVGKEMLERMGFSVLTATDGREALKVFGEHAGEIVCVLLDLTMPHMDGEEAFREMRRLHPGVVVILCSGYNEQDATQRFAGKGLAGFIQKPYRSDGLRAKLREVLES